MYHLYSLIVITNIIITPTKSSAFEAVPHLEILDELLTAKVLDSSDSNDPVFEYLFGNRTYRNKTNENLDINTLDTDNIKKIIGIAKNKAIFRQASNKTKNQNSSNKYDSDQVLINQTFNLMKQSIYATRYRLQNTKKYRKRYAKNRVYQLAILYGSFLQILLKMDNLLATMEHFPVRTQFIWYLIIYEKMLAQHTDAHNIVQRMFLLHYKLREDFKNPNYSQDED